MADKLTEDFNLRRPLLQHVATALRDQLSDALRHAKLPAAFVFAVATAEEFDQFVRQYGSQAANPLVDVVEQISGRIDVRELEQIQPVEKLVGEIVSVVFQDWASKPDGPTPIRLLHCQIPP